MSDQRKFHKIERDYELDPTEQKCGESGKKDILGWIWEESASKKKGDRKARGYVWHYL